MIPNLIIPIQSIIIALLIVGAYYDTKSYYVSPKISLLITILSILLTFPIKIITQLDFYSYLMKIFFAIIILTSYIITEKGYLQRFLTQRQIEKGYDKILLSADLIIIPLVLTLSLWQFIAFLYGFLLTGMLMFTYYQKKYPGAIGTPGYVAITCGYIIAVLQ